MNSPHKKNRKPTLAQRVIHLFGPPESNQDGNGNIKTFYQCKICEKKINGTKDYNLDSHIKKGHPEIHTEIVGKFKDPLEIKRLKILQNAVELVTVNGRPFAAIHDSGYQANIANKLNKLKASGLFLDLSHNNLPEVKNHLKLMAKNARGKIREEVRGKLIALTIDIASLNNRSFLDVSVRFIANGKLTIRSIAMIELHESHTGTYLAKTIANELKSYDIDLCSVVAICTDNGANVIKMVRDLNCLQEQKKAESCTVEGEDAEIFSENNEGINVDEEITNFLAKSVTDDEALDILLGENEQSMLAGKNDQILNEVSQELQSNGIEPHVKIIGINCVAHTVQLITKDALQMISDYDKNVIDLARSVSKSLRLQTVRDEMFLLEMDYILPRLEVKTRWCSVYLMVRFII